MNGILAVLSIFLSRCIIIFVRLEYRLNAHKMNTNVMKEITALEQCGIFLSLLYHVINYIRAIFSFEKGAWDDKNKVLWKL